MIRALPGINPTANVPPGVTPGLSQTAGAAGTVITINGANFGSSQGTGTVTFAGANGPIAATVSNWRSKQIQVTVPNGAMTGNVIVNVPFVLFPGSFTIVPATGPVFTVQ